MAIRVALGARTRDVRRLVLQRALLLASIGILLGLLCAVIATRFLGAVLYGVSPTDPTTLVVLFLVLPAVSTLAAVGPARRAASMDPLEQLRAT